MQNPTKHAIKPVIYKSNKIAMPLIPPPESEAELLSRARSMSGCSLGELAARLGEDVPETLLRNKGWVGQLFERYLGATAGSLAEPDFQAIAVELKTLPLGKRGLPLESTYVCTVPLEQGIGQTWESSWARKKLSRVLWVPLEADKTIPLAQRCIGSAFLWSPDENEEQQLRQDWEELMEMVCTGQLEKINARLGTVMQIRPKAANASVLGHAIGAEGERIVSNPKGFYLRTSFTRKILDQHYLLSEG